VWNLRHFGTIVQVSGAAKMTLLLYGGLPELHGPKQLAGNLILASAAASRYVVGEESIPARWTQPFMIVSAGLLAIAAVAGGVRRIPAVLAPLAVFVVMHFVFYGWIQRSYASWYFLPIVMAAAVWQGERMAAARTGVVALTMAASAAVTIVALGLFIRHTGFVPHRIERRAELTLSQLPLIPPDKSVGAWNAGALGYFGERRRPDLRFFNLDCLVNNELFKAIRQSRATYDAWVFAHIDYLIERPYGWLPAGSVIPIGPDVSKVRGVIESKH